MKLFTIIASAQGERTFHNMAHAFGINVDVVALTVRYFTPAIVKAVERRAQSPEGLLAVLEFFGAKRYDRFLDDPRIFTHDLAADEGEAALKFLFERETKIAKIVDNRAKVLPVPVDDLYRIFPILTLMVLGAIEVRTRRPLIAILHRLSATKGDERVAGNPYLAMAQHLKKQEREERLQRRGRLFAFLGGTISREEARPKVGPLAGRQVVRMSAVA